MKRILVFSFFPAFVPPSNGGQSRLFYFYRALSHWHYVTLLTSTHIGVDEEIIYHGLNFVERRIPKDDHFVQQYARLEPHSGGGDLSGPAIAACGKLPTRLHQAYLEEYEKADAIVHDSPFTVNYDLFVGIDDKARIYNAYNCETLLYEQLHPGDNSEPIRELVHADEQRMLEIADLVLYCNDDDLKIFKELAPNATFEAIYTPNGMESIALPEKNVRTLRKKPFHAVFMGSGHPPNVRAAEFVAHILAPALPDIVFDVIGSCLPAGNYSANVKGHGVIEDATKARILKNADIALNPMAAGSGSNVKVLEYFSYELPVLSTTFGMRGIRAEAGKDYFDASLDSFIKVIKQIVNDPTGLAAVGEAGKKLAMKKHTWRGIAYPVSERLTTLINAKKNCNQKHLVLVLNDYDPFEAMGGGGTRIRGLYKAVGSYSPVVFISFSGDGTIASRRIDTHIAVINVPKTAQHVADLTRVNTRFHVSADDIIASCNCLANSWLDAVYRVLRQFARCIIAEHCYLAKLPLAWGDRFVYSSQNNETELKNRLLEWHPLKSELLPEVEAVERLAVERSAAIIAVSREDAESLVKGKRTAGPTVVVRNGAAMPAGGEAVEHTKLKFRKQIGNRSAVFLGSSHMPNVEAALFIVEQLAPQCQDVRFHLLGSVCSAIPRAPKNVHLWGVVDEVIKSAVLQSCPLALNPMFSGSGSNVKLADYLANGLFVITTEFGHRGYPDSIKEHVSVVSKEDFARSILQILSTPTLYSVEAKETRHALFVRELAMENLAQRFVETLKALEKPKKRILYVAYRYTYPPLGGAEANIEKFVHALGRSGEFDVDVIAPEVSDIRNYLRFSESYHFDTETSVPVDIPNVRFARFPIEHPTPEAIDTQLRKAWSVQPAFERAIAHELQQHYRHTGLTWGWSYPEGNKTNVARWTFSEFGIYISQEASIDIKGYIHRSVVITVYGAGQIVSGPLVLDNQFSLSFHAKAGEVLFVISAPGDPVDPRSLGLRISRVIVDGQALDLSASTLLQKYVALLPADKSFRLLDRAAQVSRVPMGVWLTNGRGPWSEKLERFISNHVGEYDLVVTHINIFRPAVVAIEAAKKHGIPSILIPHAHLDDDFYHFPDWLESARNASLVLAVPKAACDFLAEKGCNVRYLPAGCDTDEKFSLDDENAFRKIYTSHSPFILVLGRKAGAKGYRKIIDAVESLNQEGFYLKTVLIGPDDDGIPVDSPNAVYLGRQSRAVVRGALMSCLALCNMSISESFGIVLLEAWLAGKPVIVNKHCAAFHDMAVDRDNALLVDDLGIGEAIKLVWREPKIAERLVLNGRSVVGRFGWNEVSALFVEACISLQS